MPDSIEHEIADAIGYLGIHHSTVGNWAARGELSGASKPSKRISTF